MTPEATTTAVPEPPTAPMGTVGIVLTLGFVIIVALIMVRWYTGESK